MFTMGLIDSYSFKRLLEKCQYIGHIGRWCLILGGRSKKKRMLFFFFTHQIC